MVSPTFCKTWWDFKHEFVEKVSIARAKKTCTLQTFLPVGCTNTRARSFNEVQEPARSLPRVGACVHTGLYRTVPRFALGGACRECAGKQATACTILCLFAVGFVYNRAAPHAISSCFLTGSWRFISWYSSAFTRFSGRGGSQQSRVSQDLEDEGHTQCLPPQERREEEGGRETPPSPLASFQAPGHALARRQAGRMISINMFTLFIRLWNQY